MKINRFTQIFLSFVLLASMVGCGILQAQPTSVPTSLPLPTTAPPTSTPMPTVTPMPTATPAPTPDFTSLVETLTSLGFKEMGAEVGNFFCSKGATCRNFQGINGLVVVIRNDNGTMGILRMWQESVDMNPQITTLTAILKAFGLSETEIAWVNSHTESVLAGNVEVGNFTDFTITEDLTGDYGSLQQILIKIEQVK